MARNDIYGSVADSAEDYDESIFGDEEMDLESQYAEKQRQRRELGDFVYKSTKKDRPMGANHMYYPKKELLTVAEKTVQLVPIKLDLEIENVRIRDQLTWNLNETLITPEHFAQLLTDDFDNANAPAFIPLIAEEIRRQVLEYGGAAEEDAYGDGTPRSKIEELADSEFGDLRIAINLDLNVGTTHLKDKFEWPLFSTSDISPEDFAKALCSDMGIGGEFIPAISYSIREQVCQARLNWDDAEPAPQLTSRPLRTDLQQEVWEPEVRELTEEEIDRIVREKERQSRRLRRHQPRRRY